MFLFCHRQETVVHIVLQIVRETLDLPVNYGEAEPSLYDCFINTATALWVLIALWVCHPLDGTNALWVFHIPGGPQNQGNSTYLVAHCIMDLSSPVAHHPLHYGLVTCLIAHCIVGAGLPLQCVACAAGSGMVQCSPALPRT